MPTRAQTLLSRIADKARKGNRGDPVGTVAFYGPDDQSASKVVVGISPNPSEGVTETRTWRGDPDLREDAATMGQVLEFLGVHKVKSVVMTDGIYGCPHEEGIDYAEGAACEQCAFWQGRPRDVPLIG
jgi:hypothetical protein